MSSVTSISVSNASAAARQAQAEAAARKARWAGPPQGTDGALNQKFRLTRGPLEVEQAKLTSGYDVAKPFEAHFGLLFAPNADTIEKPKSGALQRYGLAFPSPIMHLDETTGKSVDVTA